MESDREENKDEENRESKRTERNEPIQTIVSSNYFGQNTDLLEVVNII